MAKSSSLGHGGATTMTLVCFFGCVFLLIVLVASLLCASSTGSVVLVFCVVT
jgi:hypothetical protein